MIKSHKKYQSINLIGLALVGKAYAKNRSFLIHNRSYWRELRPLVTPWTFCIKEGTEPWRGQIGFSCLMFKVSLLPLSLSSPSLALVLIIVLLLFYCVYVLVKGNTVTDIRYTSLSLSPQWLYMYSGSLNHIYASLARCIMCVQAPFHAHNINSFALLSLSPQWLYMYSGSLEHIYASLASCIMWVKVPFHAHNINSFALLSLSPQWLYMYSGSLEHIYVSLASYIMCVRVPFYAHNINSFALLSLSPLNGFICIQVLWTIYMPA